MGKIDWDGVATFFSTLGLMEGVFVIFLFGAHYWIYNLYEERIADKQKEIDRLAEENHEYRDRFMEFLDQRILG